MRWVSYGPDAVLIEFAEQVNEEAFMRGRAIAAALERKPPEGMLEFVSAFTTVLVEFDSKAIGDVRQAAEELVGRLERALTEPVPEAEVTRIELVYDGPDLERVARWNGLSVEEVCTLHSAAMYKVYMLGFAPGFPYLGDLDPRLHTPRLETPRPQVPAGSVAIGGEHTGIYSVASPGGWNIIGHTATRLFDPTADKPELVFRFRQGDRVRFVRGDAEARRR